MRIGPSLALTQPGYVSGAAPAYAALTRFEILDATPLDPIPWAVGDAVPGDGTNYGIAPSGQLVYVAGSTVAGAIAGGAITGVMKHIGSLNGDDVQRYTAFTLKGPIRKQRQTSATQTARGFMTGTDGLGSTYGIYKIEYDPVGTNALELAGFEVLRGLGHAHQGAVIENLYCGPGWFGSHAAGYADPAVIFNNSVRQYREPEVHPINPEREVVRTSTRRVEFIVKHRYGQNGRDFDMARVRCRDTSGNVTPWVNVTSSGVFQVGSTDLWEEHCYADVDLTNLNAGEMCRDEIEAWPLIGRVKYLSTDYNSSDPKDPRFPQWFRNDKNNTYANGCVVIDADPAFVQSGATPGNSEGACVAYSMANFNTAIADLKTFNNATKSGTRHNDIEGIVIIRNTTGGALGFKPSATVATTNTIGEGAWYIRPHSSNNARVFLDQSWGAARSLPTRMILEDCDWNRATTSDNIAVNQAQAGTETSTWAFRRGTITLPASGTAPFTGTGIDRLYFYDVTYDSAGAPASIQFALAGNGSTTQVCKVACRINNTTSGEAKIAPMTILGFYGRGALSEPNNTSSYSTEGFIYHALMLQKIDGTTQAFAASTTGREYYVRGAFIDGMIMEYVGTSSTGVSFNIGADGAARRVENFILRNVFMPSDPNDAANNSFNRGRVNRGYCDVAIAHGVVKDVVLQGVWSPQHAVKTDQFNPTAGWSAGRVANWTTFLAGDDFGNGMMINRDPEGASGRGADAWGVSPDNDEWASLFRTVGSKYDTGPIAVNSNKAGLTTSGAVGGGTVSNYQPTGGAANPMRSTCPVGHHHSRYDLMGVLRPNDGTGANCAIGTVAA